MLPPLLLPLLLPLASAASAAATITVNPADVTHNITWTHGCHTDLGYSHQERGIFSQLLHGESFENMLEPVLPSGPDDARQVAGNTTQWAFRTEGQGASSTVTTQPPIMNGAQAASLSVDSRYGHTAAVVNRGFWQEGLALQSAKAYEGHVFARAAADTKLTLAASLEDSSAAGGQPKTLATAALALTGTGGWVRLNFTLTPSSGTACASAPWGAAPMFCEPGMADRVGAACLECGGQFVLSLSEPGNVDLDMAFLQEGSWGTLPGIPAKRATVEWMQKMGVESVRTGGTYVKIDQNEGGSNASEYDGAGYRWKSMRGPPELRPPVLQNGGGEPCKSGHRGSGPTGWCGYLRSRGYGPIEALNLAEYMNVTAMTTLGHTETPEDLADLVEYMYADPAASKWAALREADGHPAPYNTDQYYEIGNEINTPDFGPKALAMEKAAVAAGVGGKLKFTCPWQCLGSLDEIVASGAKSLGPQVVFDLHTSTPPVDPETGRMHGTDLSTCGLPEAIASLKAVGMDARIGWWETNTGTLHDMSRVMMEALDTNNLDRNAAGYRLDTRTASFCTEYSGHDDLWLIKRGDQGLIFFSANQSWGQPPAHLHSMMSATALPHALAVANDDNTTLDVVAAASEDGKIVMVRVVNPTPTAAMSSIGMMGEWKTAHLTATKWVLAAPDGDPTAANSMADPDAITPVVSGPSPFDASGSRQQSFPAMSVTIWQIERQAGR